MCGCSLNIGAHNKLIQIILSRPLHSRLNKTPPDSTALEVFFYDKTADFRFISGLK